MLDGNSTNGLLFEIFDAEDNSKSYKIFLNGEIEGFDSLKRPIVTNWGSILIDALLAQVRLLQNSRSPD